MSRRHKILGLSVLLFFSGVVLLLKRESFVDFDPSFPVENQDPAGRSKVDLSFNRASRADSKKALSPKLVPADDPAVKEIVDQLKALESRRVSYCREVESDSKILHNFVVDSPSESESQAIQKLIQSLKGLTRDKDGRVISWQTYLRDEFLFPEEFKKCIISVEFIKESRGGYYTVTGLHEGKLMMREGNAPVSSDGVVNYIVSSVRFSYDTSWRFSHLLELENPESHSPK